MALMFPPHGPKSNDSQIAEPLVYRLLKDQLCDEFSVIHSIPWLSSFVHELQGNQSPIGEIDFLILHPVLGILALEVKGGIVGHNESGFYYSNTPFDPVTQLNRGIFAIQKWLEKSGIKIQIGRAYCFPASEANICDLPPAVIDHTDHSVVKLVLDINDIGQISDRISGIMLHFKDLLNVKSLSPHTIESIIEKLVPSKHYEPCWHSRINQDNKTWLKLTDQQNECITRATHNTKTLISGWPGTGKTLVAVETARRLAAQGQKTIFLTFNKLLAKKIARELKAHPGSKTLTLHALCTQAAAHNGDKAIPSNDWFDRHAWSSLKKACSNGFLDEYSTLIVDEGQVIREAFWEALTEIFGKRRIIVMCDAAQALPYEQPVSLEKLENILDTKAFLLTESLRMPKRVCERLKIFQEPSYAVHNPRHSDEDALIEIITSNQEQALKKLAAQLVTEGIPDTHIVVLTTPNAPLPLGLVPQGVTVESIGKFRGLESPIVIIMASSKITNAEFFCAYSRATSRCFVILDAYDLKNSSYESLGKSLQETQSDFIRSEASKSLTQATLAHLQIESVTPPTQGTHIAWCESWKSYVLPVQHCEGTRLLLESYFLDTESPNIFTWSPSSRNTVHLLPSASDGHRELHTLRTCKTCGILTPHNTNPRREERCHLCTLNEHSRDLAFEKQCLLVADVLANRQNYSTEHKKKLPHQIFAIGVLQLAKYQTDQENFISAFSQLSVFGRTAMALTLRVLTTGRRSNVESFKINDVAKKTHSWNESISKLSFSSWQGHVNDAFNKLEKNGIVQKSASGSRTLIADKFLMKP
ncbi:MULTISPECIES: AAA family ATPase [unclassified Pseudomonas]|uniref:AAA family ATPase n=1 Tax=unclassified Pseudomonas TaxID=196821 RepID=UPI00257D5E06|nr:MULTISPECIES: AAA family ATPase [unclassified Pseudomonas]